TTYQGQIPETAPAHLYGSENTAASRVVTDSESIARDIKEGRLSGFVGHGTTLTGETNFQMMLRVDGHLTGTVSSDGGTLLIGTNGQVDASISVAVATVNGTVNGDIVASEKIHLGRTARVIGNVATPRLVIEEGAVFEGGCNMLKAREIDEKQQTEAEAQYNAAELARFEAENAMVETDEYLGASSDSDDDDDDDDDEKADAATI
ncbi:MAG: polymer-forming cytoskeletal protein, partial [Saprospiraceae bacterium]|nr:polymer-forming cytoskeletal protein [Pyrinomonadaceae bacterium]